MAILKEYRLPLGLTPEGGSFIQISAILMVLGPHPGIESKVTRSIQTLVIQRASKQLLGLALEMANFILITVIQRAFRLRPGLE